MERMTEIKTPINEAELIQELNYVPIVSISKPGLNDFLNRMTEIKSRVAETSIKIISQYNRSGVTFQNCDFQNLLFGNIDLKFGLKFIGCNIKNLRFSNCKSTISDSNSDFNSKNCNIEFDDCTINNLTFSECSDFSQGVLIYKKSKIIDKLQFIDYTSVNSLISIKDSELQGQLNLIRVELANLNILEETSVSGITTISNIKADSIRFDDIKIKNALNVFNVKADSFYFYKGDYGNMVDLSGLNIAQNLDLQEAIFHKFITVSINDATNGVVGSVNGLYINSCTFKESFQTSKTNNRIENVNIIFGPQMEGGICFNECTIQVFKITGNNTKASLELNNCEFNVLDFDHFVNYSNITLNQIRGLAPAPSELFITNSSLGKTQIYDVDFTKFDEIEIINCNLIELQFSNVQWFESGSLNQYSLDYSNNREVNRQLKYALEKQGNKIDSLEFKSREMKAYQSEISSSENSCGDKLILWAGRTNNFGLDPWIPMLWLLGGGFIFYCLIIIGVCPKLSYTPSFAKEDICYTVKQLSDNISKYPRLLDPTHSLERIFDSPKTSFVPSCGKEEHYIIGFGASAFSYLLKAYLAFFIFQIIKAFRKFAE